MRILDHYGVDGFYDDLGYLPLASHPLPPTKDEVLSFEESEQSDGRWRTCSRSFMPR